VFRYLVSMQSGVIDPVVTASEMAGKVERDYLSGSIRLHILHHAAGGEVFGAGLMDGLQHHGYRFSPGTLCPILHAHERGSYLRSTLEQVGGKRRLIYVATGAGKTALTASRQKVLALFHEILGDQDDAAKSRNPASRQAPGRQSKRTTPAAAPTRLDIGDTQSGRISASAIRDGRDPSTSMTGGSKCLN
jgi:PadR family transcriptional regulator PadR